MRRFPRSFLAACGLVTCLAPAIAAPVVETRCGWFSNPGPGNATLLDRDGEWTVAQQGGHRAEGDWPPKFPAGTHVPAGRGGYGHGCACLRVVDDREATAILRVLSGQARPLAACRRDAGLKGLEPSSGE